MLLLNLLSCLTLQADSTPCLLPNLQWFNCANNRLAIPPLWLSPSLTGKVDLTPNDNVFNSHLSVWLMCLIAFSMPFGLRVPNSSCLPNPSSDECSALYRSVLTPTIMTLFGSGLDLSGNRLKSLYAWLFARLPNLQLLALHNNCLVEVCNEIKSLNALR
jgi:hypothetical protein